MQQANSLNAPENYVHNPRVRPLYAYMSENLQRRLGFIGRLLLVCR